MARDDYSAGFGGAVGSRTAETHDVIDVTLPMVILQDGTVLSAVVLNLAAAKLARPVGLGATVYQPSVRRIAGITYSEGRAPDNAQFELVNLRGIYGELMLDPERTLDGAEIVVSRAANVSARTLPPVYEFDELFRGYIHGVDVLGERVTFDAVHELSDPSVMVGARELTQRCAANFEDEFCGHTGAPPGAVCSHLHDDAVAGCLFWDNLERYYAVPPLQPRSLPPTVNPIIWPGGPGNGFPDDFNPGGRHPFYDRDYGRPFTVEPGFGAQ